MYEIMIHRNFLDDLHFIFLYIIMSDQQTKISPVTSNQVPFIYFQQQGCFSLYCGLHALNNVYGQSEFTSNYLNSVCYSLSDDFINPHKHIFGGEYDANVIIKALEDRGNEVKWHDNRREFVFSGPDNMELNVSSRVRLRGFLLNIRLQRSCLSCLFRTSSRHWIAVRYLDQKFIILDSMKDEVRILQEREINDYMNLSLSKGSQIMVILQKL